MMYYDSENWRRKAVTLLTLGALAWHFYEANSIEWKPHCPDTIPERVGFGDRAPTVVASGCMPAYWGRT
jgi:hypothetical protein